MELKKYFSKFLNKRKKILSEKDHLLSMRLTALLGFEVNDLNLYKEAFTLKTSSRTPAVKNYERLEFLGDSILGSIISCYLFEAYPEANEGYLTQMKSKIVNRKNLNKIGDSLQLTKFILNGQHATLSENISGNLFEAMIGAVYLDMDYSVCKSIVLQRLLLPEEMNKLENKVASYKGLLLEWSQKKKLLVRYETIAEPQPNKSTVFRSLVWLGEEKIANATETSKKKAEEKAAQRAFYALNKKENILAATKVNS